MDAADGLELLGRIEDGLDQEDVAGLDEIEAVRVGKARVSSQTSFALSAAEWIAARTRLYVPHRQIFVID